MRSATQSVALVLLLLASALSSPPSANAAAGVVAVTAGGFHTCALTNTGNVLCWGSNGVGQLGDGRRCHPNCPTPTLVRGLEARAVATSAGNGHQCAVLEGGGLQCWGGNYSGELGRETAEQCIGISCGTTPARVINLSEDVAIVSAGSQHTCALTSAGTVKCWGRNDRGQLGNGAVADSWQRNPVPTVVTGLGGKVSAISVGGDHTCALVETAEGSSTYGAQCWGDNQYGQLGNGPHADAKMPFSATPVDVLEEDGQRLVGIASVESGYIHTCAVTEAGAVKCWGSNQEGQLGVGTLCIGNFCPNALPVAGLDTGVAAVSSGLFHSCALTTQGEVQCWGRNAEGQLGNTAVGSEDQRSPIQVTGLDLGVVEISAGQHHTCTISEAHELKCWGWNNDGQVGDGTFSTGPEHLLRPSPTTVLGLAPKLPGSADCDASVNSVDAALILQLSADLVTSLPCMANADVNADATINALDAALVLQYDAGLLPNLPP